MNLILIVVHLLIVHLFFVLRIQQFKVFLRQREYILLVFIRRRHLALLVFTFLYSPFSLFLGLGMNVLSRKHEYEADAYARDTYNGDALASALKKLSVDNLSNLLPHPAYVFFYYSHPTLIQRLNTLENGLQSE